MTKEELLSRTTDYLRFPMAIGIVFLHGRISSMNIQGHIYEIDICPWLSTIICLFSDVLSSVCVPLFFLISGFLFFYKTDFNINSYKRKIKSRYKSLFIPYIFWNFIGFIILLVELHPYFSSLFPILKDYRIDIVSFLSYFWVADLPVSMNGPSNPINTPLWFVRDLIVLILFSPLIYWLIKHLKIVPIILLGVFWFFTFGKDIGFPTLSHKSVFFFPLGAYLSLNRINFVEIAQKCKWSIIIYCFFVIADIETNNHSYNIWIYNGGILLGIIAITCLASIYIYKYDVQVNQLLSNASFFIFALHNLFMGKCLKAIFMVFHPQSPYIVLFIYFFVPITTIVISLQLYKFLYKWLPSVARIATGSR